MHSVVYVDMLTCTSILNVLESLQIFAVGFFISLTMLIVLPVRLLACGIVCKLIEQKRPIMGNYSDCKADPKREYKQNETYNTSKSHQIFLIYTNFGLAS